MGLRPRNPQHTLTQRIPKPRMLIGIQMHPIHTTDTHNRSRIEKMTAKIGCHPRIRLRQT